MREHDRLGAAIKTAREQFERPAALLLRRRHFGLGDVVDAYGSRRASRAGDARRLGHRAAGWRTVLFRAGGRQWGNRRRRNRIMIFGPKDDRHVVIPRTARARRDASEYAIKFIKRGGEVFLGPWQHGNLVQNRFVPRDSEPRPSARTAMAARCNSPAFRLNTAAVLAFQPGLPRAAYTSPFPLRPR